MRREDDTTGNLFGAEVTDDIKETQHEREVQTKYKKFEEETRQSAEEAAVDWDDLQKHIPPADRDRTDLQAAGIVPTPEQPLKAEALGFLQEAAENDKALGRPSMAKRIIERDRKIATEYRASQDRLDREIDESDAAYQNNQAEGEKLDKAA